ncbi:PEP/pyruvate-binding domain-containing protein [Methanoregula sp.]|uniref:PEP/pyruvate-binding domain-containing protein n=1 Tax=Methanoregula sp. TaxID=2052170 RepID=UPI003C51EACA
MTDETPRIVFFGPDVKTEVTADEFGNKASVLTRMSALGIPVPPGFALSVDICEEYFRNGQVLPDDVPELIRQGIAFIERSTGLRYGASRRPLLVSARSGAAVSMPGAMETILNIGLNRVTVRGLIAQTGNPRFAWDSYRRFLEYFGTIVFSHDPGAYRKIERLVLEEERVPDESGLDFAAMRTIAEQYEQLYSRTNGKRLPDDVFSQLELATTAILQSWNSSRAQTFRSMNPLSGARGTGVTVEAMVFGNLGTLSGAGVAFSRNPWTGVNELLVDFKFGAQGEDIVSGLMGVVSYQEFAARIPLAARELSEAAKRLEFMYHDMQDIEFTVQEGKLFILQSRSGKRAPLAALKIAVDLAHENIIAKDEAVGRVRDIDAEAITIQTIKTSESPLATGISASMGVASGKIALSAEHAIELSKNSPVIMVRETANPDDISGIGASLGILTVRGARTSHAAVVARQMGKVCIVSCGELKIDLARRVCAFPGRDLYEGDYITLDGQSGQIYAGIIPVVVEKPTELIEELHTWSSGT